MHKHQRQEVTGIVVNEKLQAPREIRKKIRQEFYYINKYGITDHLHKTKNLRANYIPHLIGVANHIYNINPNDSDAKDYIQKLKLFITH